IVQVGLRGDLLNVVRLGILDIDHILSSVLKPADQHEVTKGAGLRRWPCLNAFFRRLSRLNRRRCDRPRIDLWSDLFVRILGNDSLLPRYLGQNVAARDVCRIRTWIDWSRVAWGVACIDDDNDRLTAGGGSGGFRLHRR